MRRSHDRSENRNPPDLHTMVVSDPEAMFYKFLWDLNQVREVAFHSSRIDTQPICYATLNTLLSLHAMFDWIEAALIRRSWISKSEFDKKAFRARFFEEIPVFKVADAVANTTKHGNFCQREWDGGVLRAFYQEADEDTPGFWSITYQDSETDGMCSLHDSLEQSKWALWRLMSELQLTSTAGPDPDWQRIQLLQIFGDPPER